MEEEMKAEKKETTDPRSIGPVTVVLIMLYFILLTLFALYTLVQMWPLADSSDATIQFFNSTFELSNDGRLLLIVIISGALGSCVHVIRSLSSYIGERKLKWSWLPMYIFRPFAGAILALVIYLVLRGGLFSSNAEIQDTSTFGFAGIATLAGMFSEQAVLKLKEIAEQVFTEPRSGADSLREEEEE